MHSAGAEQDSHIFLLMIRFVRRVAATLGVAAFRTGPDDAAARKIKARH